MRCLLLFALALLLAPGCGPAKHPTAPVAGTVTWKDKPLTRGRVIFHHAAGHYGFADIDATGRYKGEAPVGECKVAIESRAPPPENLPPEKIVPGVYFTKSLIPERYENHMESGLKLEVKAEPNTKDWKLE
jgi:hypothetical protein